MLTEKVLDEEGLTRKGGTGAMMPVIPSLEKRRFKAVQESRGL